VKKMLHILLTYRNIILVCLSLFLCAHAASEVDLGDRLTRTFLVYHSLPLNTTEATKNGWANQWSTCDPDLGYAYVAKEGYSVGNPIVMYYTAAGQLAGVGIIHFGAPLSSHLKFWTPLNGSSDYILNVHFRPSLVVCSKTPQKELIGTQFVINQDSLKLSVPLTDKDAATAHWTVGNCLPGMGTHWAYDLVTAPTLSWKAEQTVPLLPMYFNGTISAFLVDTATFQDIEPIGVWEGPFISSLFCKNLCKGCEWSSGLTSTLHFHFRDHNPLNCPYQCNPLI